MCLHRKHSWTFLGMNFQSQTSFKFRVIVVNSRWGCLRPLQATLIHLLYNLTQHNTLKHHFVGISYCYLFLKSALQVNTPVNKNPALLIRGAGTAAAAGRQFLPMQNIYSCDIHTLEHTRQQSQWLLSQRCVHWGYWQNSTDRACRACTQPHLKVWHEIQKQPGELQHSVAG